MTRRLVLCLDGTWNSTYAGERKERDGHTVLKPSNTLKMARAILPKDGDTEQIVYYDIGVGSLGAYPGTANWLLSKADKYLGGVWAANFEGNVEDALHFITLNHRPDDDVFIFGFSRGAATARAVTRFIDWAGGKLPAKIDAYYLPVLFRRYVMERGRPAAFQEAIDEINARHTNPLSPFIPVRVKYLGIWDTVFALGSRFKATGESTSDATRTFHAGAGPAKCVEKARHALAVDETRFDFRPDIWTQNDPATHQQRWFPGVHSNVGGGYNRDGLANIAFRWVLDGAKDAGLAVDPQYVAFFKPFPLHSLYQSATGLFRVLDKVRRRTGKGRRPLVAYPNVDLDPSVIKRMLATEEEIAKTEDAEAIKGLYRPDNVIELLASKPNITTYLKSIGIDDALPADVEQSIRAKQARAATKAAGSPPVPAPPPGSLP
jgi:uncharacterized protein (DUF2235 family)